MDLFTNEVNTIKQSCTGPVGTKIRNIVMLEPDLVNTPVLQVLTVVHHTHLLHHVKPPSAVEIQDAVECLWVPAIQKGNYFNPIC